MRTTGAFRICHLSLPDRDGLVTEVYWDHQQLAELRFESGSVRIQLYPQPSGECWDLPWDDLLAALVSARERLGPDQPELEDDSDQQ